MVKFIIWIIGFMSDSSKLLIVDTVLKSVLGSKTGTITPQYAESIMKSVIKSGGNKITDFIVKD